MKPSLRLTLATTLLLLGLPALAQAQQLRIGYLNSDRVIAEARAFATVREMMEQELAPLREEIQQLERELQAAEEELRAQAPTLTEAVRQQRQQALQQQFANYQTRVQQVQQQIQTREGQLTAPVMRRIRTILEDVRAAGNYSFIIDPPDGLIVAVDPALDVTAEVIRRLDAGEGQPQ